MADFKNCITTNGIRLGTLDSAPTGTSSGDQGTLYVDSTYGDLYVYNPDHPEASNWVRVSLQKLSDVHPDNLDLTGLADDNILVYDNDEGSDDDRYKPMSVSTRFANYVTSTSSISDLADMDSDAATPSDGDYLVWSSSGDGEGSKGWKAQATPSSGIFPTHIAQFGNGAMGTNQTITSLVETDLPYSPLTLTTSEEWQFDTSSRKDNDVNGDHYLLGSVEDELISIYASVSVEFPDDVAAGDYIELYILRYTTESPGFSLHHLDAYYMEGDLSAARERTLQGETLIECVPDDKLFITLKHSLSGSASEWYIRNHHVIIYNVRDL